INEKLYEKPVAKPLVINIYGDKLELSFGGLKKPITTTYKKTINLPYANIMVLKNPSFEPSDKFEMGELQVHYFATEKTVNRFQKITKIELVNKDATVL